MVDTFVTSKGSGIWLTESSHNTIQNCTVFECQSNGIDITNSPHNLVDESTVGDCGSGIAVATSDFTSIMRSDIYGGWGGISASQSKNCTFEANTIHNNDVGISESGIYLWDTDNSSIVANEIFENTRNGIYGESCQHNYIFENHIYNNSDHGIDIIFSENITILQNNIHDNGWRPFMPNDLCGIYLGPSIDILIEGNQIWNNTPSGISLDGSTLTTIVGNEIFNNTHHGVYGSFSENITVIENQISGNGWNLIPYRFNAAGLHNYWGNWWIEDNDIWNNTEYGVWSEGDDTTVIGNRIWNSNNSGIGVSECYDNVITENTVFENEHGIELVTIGTNVTSNIIYDNNVGIYADYIGYMYLYDNDIGWNTINAFERSAEDQTYWHDNDSLGNWWGDYSGTGVYDITNGTHAVNQDLYPSKSLDILPATAIDYEISESGNSMFWSASALNPSHYNVYANDTLLYDVEWDGGDIVIPMDGLPAGYHVIEVELFHISGHSLSSFSSVEVTDLTPPTWVTAATDQEITEGDTLSVQLSATDLSGIASYSVNDTTNFAIDSTGLLTSITTLAAGNYGLTIEVEDIFGNVLVAEITIIVLPAPAPDGTALLIAAGAGGGILAIVVVIVILKKRET
ncbi:MAG: right-handed parallel beta-helix repeat-containing protein [Candidatus Thorarchaeota archaeon]